LFSPVETAPDADLGEMMLKGAQLAIEQANAEGGYRGIPFELKFRPDLGLWGASSNELVGFKYEDSVWAVFGSIDGANTHIALRVVLKLEMPMMTTSTDPTVTETNIPWLMRCMADDRQQGYALAAHIFGECGIKKVVAFRVSDRYGRLGVMEFRGASTRLGFPLRAELQWTRGDRDFTEELDRIANYKPEAIVIWGPAADAAVIVRAIRERGMTVRVFGSDRLASKVFLDAAGEAAEGVVAAASFDPTRDDPTWQRFVEAFVERFGEEPEAHAAHTFDGMNILIESIRKAGLNRPRIRDAMYACTHYDGVTGPIVLDPSLNDVGPVYIATVEDGGFVYREADFAQYSDSRESDRPYRTLAQSPPGARSPDDGAVRPGEPVRIGCFLPLDAQGQNVVKGIQAALKQGSNANTPEVELLVQDSRRAWSGGSDVLVDMVFEEKIIALIGSTERRGTHLAETVAAKFHFPVLSLCGDDPTITQAPLPWVFCLAPGSDREAEYQGDPWFALGHDAGALLVERIQAGCRSRKALRDHLADGSRHRGMTGTFRFDALGNRVESNEAPVGVTQTTPDRTVRGLLQ
jgi:ABC-type branched-subunit amino acid transport system substrate-binding protein